MAGGGNPVKAIFYAFFANLGIAIAKTAASLVTGSSSMIAEAIHSYADTGNQLLLLLGLRRSQKAPDAEHPLGYGKLIYFWSFIVAILLFSVGGLFSIYEGWHKLHATEPIANPWVALVVLAFSIALEALSMRGCLVEVNKIRGDRSLWRWLNESRNSELVVVFGEDLAALIGLVIAFGFVALASFTGNPVWDAYGSLAIGALLVVIAIFIALKVKALLIGRSADPEVRDALEARIAADDAIEHVYNVITIQVGNKIMLAAKLKMRTGLSIDEACEHINALEESLAWEIPDLEWSFMEPDIAD